METEWTKLRERLSGTKVGRLPWFQRHIRDLNEAGFQLADADMETAYCDLVGSYSEEYGCWLYYESEDRKSTYPQITRTTPNRYGFFAYGTHDRSENIQDAIDKMAELHADDIKASRAWLMPVLDDDEYVSWEFDIAIGTKEDVVAMIKKAIKIRRENEAAKSADGGAE
jgi:hypothetical protein